MVAVKLLLLSVCLHAAFCLPILQDTSEISRQARSALQQIPVLGRLSSQDGPFLSQWDLALLGDDAYPISSYNAQGNRGPDAPHGHRFLDDPMRLRPDNHHTHRRTLDYPMTKRSSEETNIPTMGLGVLSNMRKFFNELRTNLDSVEEAAVLSQEQGNFKSGTPIDPADFLALLARHGARSSETQSGETDLPRNPMHMRRLMFGYNHDDQPYAHSGLGK